MVTTNAPVTAKAPDGASVNGETDGSAIAGALGAPQPAATATAVTASHPRTDVKRNTRRAYANSIRGTMPRAARPAPTARLPGRGAGRRRPGARPRSPVGGGEPGGSGEPPGCRALGLRMYSVSEIDIHGSSAVLHRLWADNLDVRGGLDAKLHWF